MKFLLEIELGNDGMQTLGDVRDAVNTCIHSLSDAYEPLECGEQAFLWDINGNTVGKWEVVATAGDPHPHVGVGYCAICGHYGKDCTGNR